MQAAQMQLQNSRKSQPLSNGVLPNEPAGFAFMHIVFRNPAAVTLSFAGRILIATRYAETGSLARWAQRYVDKRRRL
jgi:hypothetical protein